MEPKTPARALVAIGAAVVVTFGGGIAPVSGLAAADPAPRSTIDQSEVTRAEVLPARAEARRSNASSSGRWAGSVNTSRMSSVNAAYRSSFASGMNVPTGFTGSEKRCQAGTSSAQSRAATLRAINYVRSLAGLAPVSFSPTLNARSQQTALMMSANKALSHAPSRSWRCYSAAGAANAGRANLALAYPKITSASLVELYMRDPGASNKAVGHRRWMLNPATTQMGSGSTNNANAVTVIGPTRAGRPNPAFVAWPSAGYFPRTLEPGGRWSLSSGNKRASFKKATVRVFRNGQAVRAVRYRPHTGYAMPTLVWQINAAQAKSGTYKVVVRGIKIGKRKVTRTYSVRMFSPN